MSKPLYVALVWHMHQPYYKDTITGEYTLPWARLHAVKDYLHMIEMVAEQPGMHVTFNYVPCLSEQLLEYASGAAVDRALQLSLQEQWTPEEKEFMLSFFFNINWERFVRRYPRYAQLLELRNMATGQASLFGDAYYRDLAAWFNLVWIDRTLLEQDPVLSALVAKGQNFTTADVRAIIQKQREFIARILPRHRELEAKGQIEVTASPYYHPILPLLVDIRAAREASPRMALPGVPFSHPEDAVEQLRRGISAHEQHFGRRPRGLWPSEGSVSQAIASQIIRSNGLHWLATDEGILSRSLNAPIYRDGYGHVTNPRILYRPYRLTDANGAPSSLQIIFRDVVLSDRIGFVYKHMSATDAVNDLIQRLHRIQQNLAGDDAPHLVSIILDGENCWEEYEDNGTPFLRYLYHRLVHDPDLQPVTVSEYLDQFPAQDTIPHLFAGSWINHNLETWIGESAQNRAWEYLARTRQWLVNWQRDNPLADLHTLEQAWNEIYIAEGSDWFWWYYSRNNPAGENLFDREFRHHLRNVYRLVGAPSPAWLNALILLGAGEERSRPIGGYISPPLTAQETPSQAWVSAGLVQPESSSGTMQRAQTGVQRLYYGYDRENLYFRIEASEDLSEFFTGLYLCLPYDRRSNQHPRFLPNDGHLQLPAFACQKEVGIRGWTEPVILSRADGQEVWEQQMTLPARVNNNVAEFRVPFSALDVKIGDVLNFVLVVARENVVIQVLPGTDQMSLPLEELG